MQGLQGIPGSLQHCACQMVGCTHVESVGAPCMDLRRRVDGRTSKRAREEVGDHVAGAVEVGKCATCGKIEWSAHSSGTQRFSIRLGVYSLPSALTRTLSPFTSRWMYFFSWTYAKAPATCTKTSRARNGREAVEMRWKKTSGTQLTDLTPSQQHEQKARLPESRQRGCLAPRTPVPAEARLRGRCRTRPGTGRRSDASDRPGISLLRPGLRACRT